MQINADFSERASVDTSESEWVASPMEGVDRRMLDRVGDEVARATSIVRYAEGSAFPEHTHDGGEEFIVLEGVFQDEHGDYPAGTYVRNPPTTHHVPRSDEGCTIFVKLWQFDPRDEKQFSVDSNALELSKVAKGIERGDLHHDSRESVLIEQWEPEAGRIVSDRGGAEVLVLEGKLVGDGVVLEKHDWLRLPTEDSMHLTAGPEGARLWIKVGHLEHIRVPDSN